MARARARGVPTRWLDDMLEFAIIPHRVFYLDVDVGHLLQRVLAYRELDHWESGKDFLPKADRYASFVKYQDSLLNEFRSLADQYQFKTIDARLSVRKVFETLRLCIRDALKSVG